MRQPELVKLVRFIVYGLGAVGGVIAGMLARSGESVVGIARGAMLEALRTSPLHVSFPDEEFDQPITVVAAPSQLKFQDGDVVLLTMKTQDTPAALAALKAAGAGDLPIVCVQNAVENERLAARLFRHVYGACVQIPCRYETPGFVEAYCAPVPAILDIGRYPSGTDDTCKQMAAAFENAQISCQAQAQIMRWKYMKLLTNLGNAIEATSTSAFNTPRFHAAVRAEGEACLKAAGISFASEAEDQARRGGLQKMQAIKGEHRKGGSTWQSLVRHASSLEVDYLSGEIVSLGREHSVPTPANQCFLNLANEMLKTGAAPGSIPLERVEADLAGLTAAKR